MHPVLFPIGMPCAGWQVHVDSHSLLLLLTAYRQQYLRAATLYLPLARLLRQTELPGTPSLLLAIAGLRASCKEGPTTAISSLVASRQAPNLPQTAANENSHTLPFQTRFRAPSGHAHQCGGEEHQLTDFDDNNWR